MNETVLANLANLKTALQLAQKQAKETEQTLDHLKGQAYADRNLLVLLAADLAQDVGWRVGWKIDLDEPDWLLIFINLPTGQLSWHIPKDDLPEGIFEMFADEWDGHSTEEKNRRIMEYIEGGKDDSDSG